jgi:hypothetical protein
MSFLFVIAVAFKPFLAAVHLFISSAVSMDQTDCQPRGPLPEFLGLTVPSREWEG